MGVSSKKKRIWINVLIHFVLILLLLICLLPIALVVINAFKTNAEIVRNPLSIPKVLHLENFIQAWTTGKFAHGETPVAERVSKNILTLPMYADLAMEDVDRICGMILSLRM